MYAQDSIDLLTRSGIEFKRHEQNGIDVSHFGELLMSSGIVLSDNIKWITFHSGYDFGYLYVGPHCSLQHHSLALARLKILTCKPLPAEEMEFFELVKAFFPCIYDIKYALSKIPRDGKTLTLLAGI